MLPVSRAVVGALPVAARTTLANCRDHLLDRLPDFAAAAAGPWRDFPATQPIFYRRDRLRPRDAGWFFFSETPEVIYSRTFDGSYPAFASWAVFERRSDGAQLGVLNLHLDYSSGENRRRSAELVAARMRPRIAAGEAWVLAGDLNARHGSELHAILEGAGFGFLPVAGATYHFNRGLDLFGAIDHLALAGPVAALGPPAVLRRRFDGEWPSDHYPVAADLRLACPQPCSTPPRPAD